jgi:hypothetical protein
MDFTEGVLEATPEEPEQFFGRADNLLTEAIGRSPLLAATNL